VGRKREIPPHPKAVKFVIAKSKKAKAELRAALQAELKRLQAADEAGDHGALLAAIDLVLRHHFSGTWVAETYARRLGLWERWERPDLADAFGVMRSKDPRTIKAKRMEEKLRVEVVSAVVERRRQGLSREEAIPQAAKLFKVSETTVARIYDHNRRLRAVVENLPTLRFFARKPETP
jgi:hypothetical protein